MAHQSSVSEIRGDFGDVGAVRAYNIVIQDEALVLAATVPRKPGASLAAEFDAAVSAVGVADTCAFLLLRTTDDADGKWLLLAWAPETAPVRAKMQLAYCQAAVKRLVPLTIADTMMASVRSELTHEAYMAHVAGKSACALSPAELERRELDASTPAPTPLPGIAGGVVAAAHGAGVALPVDPSAEGAVAQMAEGAHVILTVDHERATLAASVPASDTNSLAAHVPASTPAFILSRIDATHYAFTFWCPEAAKIKERMVASAAKSALVSWLRAPPLDIQVAKHFHATAYDDLPTPQAFREVVDELGPATPANGSGADPAGTSAGPTAPLATSFKRPRPPGRRG